MDMLPLPSAVHLGGVEIRFNMISQIIGDILEGVLPFFFASGILMSEIILISLAFLTAAVLLCCFTLSKKCCHDPRAADGIAAKEGCCGSAR